jgi:hypothetical protein
MGQENRLGHGVASATFFCTGRVTVAAGAEEGLETVVGQLQAASPPRFAPFSAALLSAELAPGDANLQLRSAAGVAGYPVPSQTVNGGDAPLVLHLGSGSDSPVFRTKIFNPNAGDVVLNVALQG